MKRLSYWRLSVVSCLVLGLAVTASLWGQKDETPSSPEKRAQAEKVMSQGNFNDAYKELRQLALDPKNDAKLVGRDLNNAVNCLRQLGRIAEFDELVEASVKAHAGNWRLLQTAANEYLNPGAEHYGFIVAGKYERGDHRGDGQMANSLERDRVRGLQLLVQAMPLTKADDQKAEVAGFYLALAEQLLYNRGFEEAWRLQYLTNLAELPDYDDGYPYFRESNGAPVDAEGKPVYHAAPQSWETAKTDGERWRWAHEQAIEHNPALLNQVRWQQAQFYQNQFGVESMQQFGFFFGRFFGLPVDDDDTKKNESGTYAMHTLKENETIARLASGIKRFEVPDEFNYIKILQQIAAEPKTGLAEEALNQLANSFANRRQYPQSAGYWKQSIEKFGPGPNKYKQDQVGQIEKNWCRFEPISSQPAGQGATIEFRFRNAKKAHFEAAEIKVDKLLEDLKAYLKSDPKQLDWEKIQVDNLGYRLIDRNQTAYVGEKVADWDLDLEPRENHFDKRITIATPLQKPGAYLVTAKLEGGNISKIVLWVTDTAIVHKQLSGKNYYFVADANSGKPVDGVNLEFFGYQQKHLGNNVFQTITSNFAEKADKDGQVMPDNRDLKNDFQWLITARGEKGRFAYLGFVGVWTAAYHDEEYNTVRVYCITDRPVYRPEQKVEFKVWVREAKYDQEGSEFAKQSVPVEILNPKGEKVLSQTLETDEYGGLSGTYELPKDATLGQYTLNFPDGIKGRLQQIGGNTFRVEEYKKPEYEVTIDAPTEPVMLGEKIKAQIKAKYYFGSPVVNAKVKFKVTRTDYKETWYPIAPWDWCFGPGYWWYAYDYPWYPGWKDWCGCRRPLPPWWFQGQQDPPEVVAEQEVPIGADGTVDVDIDTLIAKELHGDTDHQYAISAEVRDESRRTIVGTGNVLVARKPFKVFSWVDRGYYRVGDTVKADFLAQTLDKKPVEGTGELTLYKISYDKDRQAVETPVRRWELNTNVEGRANQQLRASAKGQYRLAYKVTDSKKHVIEGGYLFTIMGDGFDGKDYRFNSVELIPDKREYNPGDKIKLQINTDRADGTVLLFIRPANGVYLPPKVVRLKGKSTVEEIDVIKKDMPNFFVEAVTVASAGVHSEAKEIVVPPEKRVLNVEVLPSAKEYKPGEDATVKIHLTDFTGENFEGTTVVSVYDKAVEYISGGSNVPDIKEFFWKWRRHHQPNQQTSLGRWEQNHGVPTHIVMGDLGIFGGSVAEEMDGALGDDMAAAQGQGLGGFLGAGGGLGGFGGGGGGGRAMFAKGMRGGPMATAAPGGPVAESAAFAADAAPLKDGDGPGNAAAAPALQEAAVRTNFADTALWKGSLTTDKTGMAEVSLKMPENLTGWKVKVWGLGHGTRVGEGSAEVVTRKNLILRLQAPRFFIQKDEVVLSANVHNYLKTDKEVVVSLETPGEELKNLAEPTQKIMVPAGGEKRVDWRVKVEREGTAVVRMKALTDEESDAMEMKLPAYVHGMLKTESWAGTVRPDKEQAKVTLNVPKERRPEQSLLEIRYSPTLAGAMVDALPYLADYPYGCTEQTLNRFLPTVITQKVLLEMKLNLAEIRDKRTNLNAQEIGDDKERAKQWKRFDRNPVFDQEELNRMVKDGVTALTNMQCSDGGWGWFSGWGERSYPHTTAVVVHGLQVAKQNDAPLVPGMLERGVAWLQRYQAEQVQWIKNAAIKGASPAKQHADNLDAMVYMILIDANVDNVEMREFLYRDRIQLAVYAKAMFGLALDKVKDNEKRDMLVKNIEQFLVQDAENESAYLKLPEGNPWWYWYGSETEANAYYLKLLSRVDAKGEAAPRLVKYLLNNRKHATYWASTRDTAVCVEAFADYIRASGEQQPDMVVEIWLDGEKKKEVEIKGENLFTYDNKFVLAGADVKVGSHEVEIRRKGKGPVYFNAYLTNFTLEDHIAKAGLEIKVDRTYYKLERVDKKIKVEGTRGQAVDQKVEKYQRRLLENLSQLKSGDLVEIELEIDSKNDYEYILFEDMKASGFEAVDVRSGYSHNGLGAYMELRDNRVSFFVRQLARGKNSISYRMRAEIPGQFSALPTRASAMYAPELKANSDEIKLKIAD